MDFEKKRYWPTYWLRKREISHVRCWEALHHQADQKTAFDLEWPGCTSFADVTFSTTCCNPISQRIPTPNVLYWPDLGDEETAQHLLVTQEPGKKVSCVISESQPQETTTWLNERCLIDWLNDWRTDWLTYWWINGAFNDIISWYFRKDSFLPILDFHFPKFEEIRDYSRKVRLCAFIHQMSNSEKIALRIDKQTDGQTEDSELLAGV